MVAPLVWQKNSNGILKGVRFISSPNCDERPAGEVISLLVIHAISLPPGEFGGHGVESLFTQTLDPGEHPYYQEIEGLKVSSHFFIRRDGELIQFVSCDCRAWHAGISSWQGRECCNDFSVGIELEGCDERDFEASQYEMLNQLIATLRQRYPITAIVGHSEIAPGRKTDPGPCFDWTRIRGC
ncbi:MAG: 1,6-anhydro-N-acetylmuramyl-L-alanine amidase AmpD [Georgfuchsia sp.]